MSNDQGNGVKTSGGVNRGAGWAGGAVLIVIGIVFLLRNMNLVDVSGNWWALFILIPAIASFSTAWRLYQGNGGRLTRSVRVAFVGGLVPLAIALIFFFDMNWGAIWPVFLIFGGLSILVSALE